MSESSDSSSSSPIMGAATDSKLTMDTIDAVQRQDISTERDLVSVVQRCY